jgi:SAM-dependent methyltransferase
LIVSTFFVVDNHDHSVVQHDPYLSTMYRLAYSRLRELIGSASPDRTIEVGAGLGLSVLSGQSWIMSDVTGVAPLSLLNAAEALPYNDATLDAIVLKDTWHHIPNIEAFLAEAHRVLRPHGVIAVFDPYWSILGRFVYRFLHQERWDAKTESWSFPSTNPWDSNQALTYLMMQRDRAEFDQRWNGRFRVIEPQPLIGPSFLLSGGVSRRTFVSGRLLAALLRWEERRGRWYDHLRFFHVFGLVKQ